MRWQANLRLRNASDFISSHYAGFPALRHAFLTLKRTYTDDVHHSEHRLYAIVLSHPKSSAHTKTWQ